MLDFLTSLSRTFRDSVLVRLGLAMGTLALLSFISILISTVIADSSSGKANAINLSGSMRMMSFRLLSEVQQPDKRNQVPATIEEYEHRLQNLEHVIYSRMANNEALMGTTAIVVEQWQSNIRPLAQAAAANDPEALTQIARDVPHFVEHINRVVWLIEEDLEERIHLLRVTQFVLLAIIIALSLVTSWMLRRLFVLPLAELLKASRTVSHGAFTARVAHVGNDELGQLGQAFNTMISEIANMYAHLEDKVEERTRELTRTNQNLELLYRTSQQLSASELGLDNIQNVLADIQRELELGHSMICIRENGHLPARPILGNLGPDEREEIHSRQDCAQCLRHAQTTVLEQEIEIGGRQLVILPIGDTDQLEGALSIFAKSGEKLPREKLRILETVGLHISNALSNMQRAEEKHRLAVLEERAVIARELHDSIAQSLSYLKIQITRLEQFVKDQPDALVIAQELRNGLNSAYKELRELITFFRLRIDERGVSVALQETVEEYSGKLGFPVTLSNTLAGIVLSGNEEMHVIRIVREALVNIEKHAEASEATVMVDVDVNRKVTIRIMDNGKGFDPKDIPPNHYGMSIMQDRTHSLDGILEIDTSPGKGTRIEVNFVPQKYRPVSSDY